MAELAYAAGLEPAGRKALGVQIPPAAQVKTLTQEKDLRTFRKILRQWYGSMRRDLPWRKTRDPYAIWLSEIMLQQTTVETVIPYYEKFLARFPTLESVAKAPESELLRFWAGLGYYNRIRNFQGAARIVVNDHGGRVPEESDRLRKLPGIGSYTAAAIASIAFSKPASVVDGNVIRVVSRLFAYKKEISTTTAKAFFKSKADFLLDRSQPGDFNQAMMELGAVVCTPVAPDCPSCPVQAWCRAKAKNLELKLPLKSKKMKTHLETYECLIRKRNSKILLRPRKSGEIMEGMWELPLVRIMDGSTGSPCPRRPISHTIMNRRMRIYPIEKTGLAARYNRGMNDGRWIAIAELKTLPLTTITRKVLQSRGLTV